MKAILIPILCALFSVCIISCSSSEEEISIIECDPDALFLRDSARGSMVFVPCYDVWAIEMDETNAAGNPLYAASKEISDEFSVEGLDVIFDGCFYDFDLPLIIPDPSFFGEIYLVRDYVIEVYEE